MRGVKKDFPIVESAVLAPQLELRDKEEPRVLLQSLLSEDQLSRRIHSVTFQVMEIFSHLQHGQWGVGLSLHKGQGLKKNFSKKFESKEFNDTYLLQMARFIEAVNSITSSCVESFQKFDLLFASEKYLFKERVISLLEK